MKARSRVLVVVGIVVACFAATVVMLNLAGRAFKRSMAASYEFKRGHIAPGTVTSFQVLRKSTNDAGAQTTGVSTVCFTIDSFSDVPNDLQTEYADAERARMAKEGPMCITARGPIGQIQMAPGNPIKIEYLLENSGVIDVSTVVIHGQELSAM